MSINNWTAKSINNLSQQPLCQIYSIINRNMHFITVISAKSHLGNKKSRHCHFWPVNKAAVMKTLRAQVKIPFITQEIESKIKIFR